MGEHIEKKVNAMGYFFQGEEYSKRYNVFLEKSQQNRRELDNISRYLPSALQALHTPTDECRVLSIGCGNGEVDFEVLKIIRGVSQKKIYCRLIEPNEHSLDKCKERLANKDGMEFDINKPRTFQNYMAEQKSERGLFDVVHFIHSIYFMDFEEALTHCFENEMREGGIIMCVTGEGLIHDAMHKTRNTVFDTSHPNQSITEIINKHGWKYQSYKDEYLVDVTEILDDQSEIGNLFLDFITQTLKFRHTANPEKVKEILNLIDGKSVHKDGKRFCKKVDYYTFISK